MPELPVPTYVSLTLGYLAVRAFLRGTASPSTLALIGVCALQSLIVALAQHHGLSTARAVQPFTAALVPPVAWLAFVVGARRPLVRTSDAWHLAGPAAALACALSWRSPLDVLLPALYVGYGLALLGATSGSGRALPRARLESGGLPALLWRCVGIALLASAASDLLILLDQVFGGGRRRSTIVGVFSSANLLLLGLLGLSRELVAGDREPVDTPGDESRAPSLARVQDEASDVPVASHAVEGRDVGEIEQKEAMEDEADAVLLERLDSLMETRRLFLDPDLTLARLARRLGVPVKRLSAAINRVRGENVSRHVNRYRIAHARESLRDGASVTVALHDSGFATKSNFNREFLRIEGVSPSEWRRGALESGARGE